ncbi:hypothetical protein GCM10009718_34680 [Isoptericola halotolerans]|uniref:ABC-2 type transport system permease protein n=1 Tax=Isoptericola halotolerans TaxID=300560 RepID=A0ABX2A2T8_9MICO|nr:ABC transporter permease [Isoptericola halotolerans]NOV97114.1 ABC-2 type transport system permease protein [Isoptericola halotolerans]
MTALGTALRVEALAWRRSTVQRLSTALVLVLVPLAAVGLTALARSGTVVGAGAAKLEPYATGDLATTQLAAAGQILSVSMLIAVGFALAATFGQPLADGRAGACFGLATPRPTIAAARCLVVLGRALACVVPALGITAALAAVTSSGLGPEAWAAAGRGLAAGMLGAGLGVPFAAVATATRSPLATVGALIGVVALTQMVVLVGGGSWFPYAVPSLWTGMGGAEAAAGIGPAGLLLTAAVAPVGIAVVTRQWHRLTDV